MNSRQQHMNAARLPGNVQNRSGAWTWDMLPNSVWWSQQLQAGVFYGAPLSPTPEALFAITHEDDRPQLKIHFKKLGENGEPFQTIIRTLEPYAGLFLLITAEPAATQGYATGTIVNVTDEILRMQQKPEDTLGKPACPAHTGIIEILNINHKTAEVTWSDNMFSLLGYEPAAFVPTREHLYAFLDPDDVDRIASYPRQAVEMKLQTRTGTKWFLFSGQVITGLDALIERQVFTFTDIDYLKQQQHLLMHTLDEMSGLVNRSLSITMVIDAELNIIFYNEAFRECFAPVRKKIPFYAWSRHVQEHAPRNLFRWLNFLFSRGTLHDTYTELPLTDKNGGTRQVRWHRSLITYRGTKALLCSGIDLTPGEKRMSRVLVQNKQLKEFAHLASHNLRGPVNNSISLINLYRQSQKAEEKDLFVEKLSTVTHKLLATLNEIAHFLKDTEQAEREEDVHFPHVLEDTLNLFSEYIRETQAQIKADFSRCPSVRYKRIILESVFQNLVSNSIKYRSILTHPEIAIESKKQGNRCVLTFTDNGSGIDLEKYGDQLFGLYNTFHHNDDAHGVGLYLIKSQIEDLGGSVHVQSEPGKGTRFTITL